MVYSVQVKRLRHESPIDALVVRGAKRKRADDGHEDPFVFRLAHTYNSEQADKHIILEGSKQTSGAQEEQVFAIADKKRQRRSSASARTEIGPAKTSAGAEDSALIPPELHSMIAEYITAEEKSETAPKPEESDKETEDYVFDVYFSDKAGPIASGNIGYIDVKEGQEKLIYGDSSSDVESSIGEDEDSNAEDYYKNDYPDEDDSDARSSRAISDGEGEFGSDLDDLLGDKMGDLHLNPEWSEDDGADDEDANLNRYGWR